MLNSKSQARYRFGPFVLGGDRLQVDGATVHLAAKPLGVLRTLVANPGEIVDKEDLIAAVWGERAVSDESLSRSVFLVRQALGDNDCERSRYVETVYGRGYRFVAPVTASASRCGESGARRRLAPSDPRQRAAQELCLRARMHMARGLTNVPAAIALYERALATDPTYVPALAGLGECNLWHASSGTVRPRQVIERARIVLEDARRLDPSDGRSHACLAFIHGEFDFDLRRAERELELAMRADPADPSVRWIRGRHLISVGDFGPGLDEFDAAATLDPANANLLAHRALAAVYAGRIDLALERTGDLARLEPDLPIAQMAHAVTLALAERHEEAASLARRLLERPQAHPHLRTIAGIALASAGHVDVAGEQLAHAHDAHASGQFVAPTYVALLAAELGDREAAYRWLDVAVADSCPVLAFAGVYPQLRRYHDDPPFRRLLRRIGREFLLDRGATETRA